MERRGEVQLWPRPPVPEFSGIMRILGEDIHAMLRRETTVAAALASAQHRIDALMRENGRY
jgi:multiple sugar transport system substrate-binding protein